LREVPKYNNTESEKNSQTYTLTFFTIIVKTLSLFLAVKRWNHIDYESKQDQLLKMMAKYLSFLAKSLTYWLNTRVKAYVGDTSSFPHARNGIDKA